MTIERSRASLRAPDAIIPREPSRDPAPLAAPEGPRADADAPLDAWEVSRSSSPVFTQRRAGDHYERPSDTLDAQPVITDPVAAKRVQQADAHATAGQVAAAYRTLAEVMRDEALPKADRAHAAVRAGLLAYRRNDTGRAEYHLVKALELASESPEALKLAMYLASKRGDSKRGLELVDALKKTMDPPTVELLRFEASFLVTEARVEDALKVASQAYARAAEPAVSASDRLRATVNYGFVLYKNQKADEAVKVLRSALELDPDDRDAHAHIAEIVIPDFTDEALRRTINAKLREANQAYQAKNYPRAQELAKEILTLDPNEGLAHKLIIFAKDRLKEVDEDAKAGAPQVLPAIATTERQEKLVAKLTELTGAARVGNRARPGQCEDLFPDWQNLTLAQRATVAYSVLAYGKLIPAIVEQGVKYRFVLPGQSACDVDPHAVATRRKAFGRYPYSGRGWAYFTKNFVVSGVETVDAAMRGKHNTVMHEFAHVVHFFMAAARDRVLGKKPGPVTDRDRQHAKLCDELERLYQQAKGREEGQQLFDAYSGNDVWEYFAQGMGAYLTDADTSKLFTRNPNLWRLMESVASDLRRFPKDVPSPAPLPISQETANAGPLLLDKLRRTAKDALVRARAELSWLQLEPLYDPVAADVARAAGAPMTPGEPTARKARLTAIDQRASQLARIDEKKLPRNHLDQPELQIPAMSGEELAHQLHAELQRAAELGPKVKLDPARVEELRALYRALRQATKGDKGLARLAERVPAELLAKARAELLALHAQLEPARG